MARFRGWLAGSIPEEKRNEWLKQLTENIEDEPNPEEIRFVVGGDSLVLRIPDNRGGYMLYDCFIRGTCSIESAEVHQQKINGILAKLSKEDRAVIERELAELQNRAEQD